MWGFRGEISRDGIVVKSFTTIYMITLFQDKLLEELNRQVLRVGNLENKLDEKSGAAKDVLGEVSKLRLQLEEKNLQLNKLKSKIENKAELENVSRMYNDTRTKLSESQNIKLEELGEMPSAAFDKEIERIMAELDDRETSLIELEGEMSLKEEEIVHLNTQLNQSVEVAEKYKCEREDMERSLEKLEDDYKIKTEELVLVKEMNMKHNDQLVARMHQLEIQLEHNHDVGDVVGQFERELSPLKQEREDDNRKAKECHVELMKGNVDIQTLREELNRKNLFIEELRHGVLETEELRKKLNLTEQAKGEVHHHNQHLNEQVESLSQYLKDLNTEKLNSSAHIEDLILKCDSMNVSHNEKITELNTRIEALNIEKEDLENDLNTAEEKLTTQRAQYDGYINDMTKAQDLSSSSVEAENSKLLKSIHDKDQKINDTESKYVQLMKDLEQSKDLLQSTLDEQQQVVDMLNERELELTTLRGESNILRKNNEEQNLMIKKYEAEMERFGELERKYKTLADTNKGLQESCTELKNTIARYEKQTSPSKVEAKTLDVITDLESEIVALNKTIESNSERIGKYERRVQELQTVLHDHEQSLKDSNDNVHQLSSELTTSDNTVLRHVSMIETLQAQIKEQQDQVNMLKHQLDQNEVDKQLLSAEVLDENSHLNQNQKMLIRNSVMNGQTGGDLKSLLSQKDNIITELRNSNASLMHLLEERSMSTHGSKVGTFESKKMTNSGAF